MKFIVVILGTLLCTPVFASNWVVKNDKTNQVTWEAQGYPGFLRINGEGGKVSGSAKERGTWMDAHFSVDLRPFKTGMDLRDEHMHQKYLQTAKYRKAFLAIKNLNARKTEQEFTGVLSIKGVGKNIKGNIKLERKAKAIQVTAGMELTIKSYPSIGVPSYLGVTMAEKVYVEARFTMVPK